MSRTFKDIGVCLAIIAASAIVYWDSLKLRVRTYDPLGSGTMPRMVAIGIILLCLVAIAQAIFERKRPARPDAAADQDFQRRPWLAVTIFAFLVVGAIMLALQVPFGITGSLLVFASILAIKKFERAVILPAAALSLIFGFGLAYVFGNIFNVDLP